MELVDFLRTVVTTDEGWFCLAYARLEDNKSVMWSEMFFKWPDQLHVILDKVSQLTLDEYNIYFSPYLFSEQRSAKECVLPSRTIVADLDEANVLTLPYKPTVLVETSADRHQGYWIIREDVTVEEQQDLSKRMTYSIPRCDRNGWFAGKKVRVPGTINTKYRSGNQFVHVVDYSNIIYSTIDLEALPTLELLFGSKAKEFDQEENLDWVEEALKVEEGPLELLRTVRHVMPARIVAQYGVRAPDRSTALWALMTSAFRAGLSRKQVFHLAYHSANNKFTDIRYNGNNELGKDVLRAELEVNLRVPDVKGKIIGARRLPGLPSEKNTYIAHIVRDHLALMGKFVHADDDSLWYVRDDIGRPISITYKSYHLQNMLDSTFGINASEKDCNYVVHALMSYTNDIPSMGKIAALSYYDEDTRTFLLHTGRKDVLKVTRDSIERVDNGYSGILFPWNIGNSAINPNYVATEEEWADILFDGCFNNVIGLTVEQAKAIVRVWLITVLMREVLISRPILALYGQQGSGKSTLMRRVFALLYGKDRSVSAITKEDNFDIAVSSDPVVVLDNIDSHYKWLPDRLALSASTSEIVKRRLYTDTDTVTMKRQAMLAVTSHNPQFGREDVTDRMLIITFERLQHFLPETDLVNTIMSKRNVLWGGLLLDIQKVLREPEPTKGWPQFRIEDFAKFGYWIASALGIQDAFHSGLEAVRTEQKMFLLSEEQILIEAIMNFAAKADKGTYYTAGQIYSRLEMGSRDPQAFRRMYGNATAIGKKLWVMYDALKEVVNIEWKFDSSRGSRTWKITSKTQSEGVLIHAEA